MRSRIVIRQAPGIHALCVPRKNRLVITLMPGTIAIISIGIEGVVEVLIAKQATQDQWGIRDASGIRSLAPR